MDNFNPYMGRIKLFRYLQKKQISISDPHLTCFSVPSHFTSCFHPETVPTLVLLLSCFHPNRYPTSISISIPIINCGSVQLRRFIFWQNHKNVSSLIFHGLRKTSLTHHRSPYTPLHFPLKLVYRI